MREDTEALRAILEARADPNVIIGSGALSPLRNVICFARTSDVCTMRQLLLDHGAIESKEDKERWRVREKSDAAEAAWLRNFHKDDRES